MFAIIKKKEEDRLVQSRNSQLYLQKQILSACHKKNCKWCNLNKET